MTPSRKKPSAKSSKPKHFLAWSVFNQDLMQLEFFRRILEEAASNSVPLLERLKFLSIFATNLDEFFMVRVSGIKEMMGVEDIMPMPGELSPVEQLKEIRKRVLPLVEMQGRCLNQEVIPGLKREGIEIVPYASLAKREKQELAKYFTKNIFLVLTPQSVDPAHPFPYMSNLSLNIGLTVERGEDEIRFVRIKVPPVIPRLLPLGKDGSKFVLVEEVIAANVDALFPSMKASEGHLFRVTRDADVEIRDDKAADLLALIKESLRERRFGLPVRLEVSATMPGEMVEYLTQSLEIAAEDVYPIDGVLNVPDLMGLYGLDRPELKDKPLQATVPSMLRRKETLFDSIKQQDQLLHHPYTSFATVTDFIWQAAHDEKVLAIKICLYRTGQNSPIPKALIEASERGKQVTAVVEIKARFDEANNIEWADRLAERGIHVVYGHVGLKTHGKLALVVRREDHGLQTYVHIATGNYNPSTSKLYTDLGLLTTDPDIGDDATDIFNYLTGFSMQKDFTRLMVAPLNLRERMVALIERETAHATAGRPARITAKVNRLTDLEIIESLYRASQAGVDIDLIVRGACMVRPGVPGLSQTIKVRSIVGRFLEHSRIFYFANGGEEEVYIGSADWMTRNLSRRVEVVAPVLDAQLRKFLKDTVLAAYLRDNVQARILNAEGTYEVPQLGPEEELFNSQTFFEGDNSFPAVEKNNSKKEETTMVKKMMILAVLLLSFSTTALAQKTKEKKPAPTGERVLWREPTDIESRDLFLGPGGEAMKPNLSRVTFLKDQAGGGFSINYRVRDGSGKVWVAKLRSEAQPETAAVRLMWALGYVTEINYLVPCIRIEGAPASNLKKCEGGGFANAKFEARPEEVKRLENWQWASNPFTGTKEFQGMIVMMSLMNNWDLKDDNNRILYVPKGASGGPELQYILSDLGATFGKTGGFISRSRNKPEDYAKAKFIEGVEGGRVKFAYGGKNSALFDSITVEQAKWIGTWLARLSDKQLSDAFRAANYTPEEVQVLTNATRARINQLTSLQ